MHSDSVNGAARAVAQELLKPLNTTTVRHGGANEFYLTRVRLDIRLPEGSGSGGRDVGLASVVWFIESLLLDQRRWIRCRPCGLPQDVGGARRNGRVSRRSPSGGISAPAARKSVTRVLGNPVHRCMHLQHGRELNALVQGAGTSPRHVGPVVRPSEVESVLLTN